jgi:hypothetical protein
MTGRTLGISGESFSSRSCHMILTPALGTATSRSDSVASRRTTRSMPSKRLRPHHGSLNHRVDQSKVWTLLATKAGRRRYGLTLHVSPLLLARRLWGEIELTRRNHQATVAQRYLSHQEPTSSMWLDIPESSSRCAGTIGI